VKEEDGDDKLKEKEKKWGIGGAVKYGLVPLQICQGTPDR